MEAFTSLQQRITAIRYSRDGKLLVLGTQGGEILIFHASRYRQIARHQLQCPGEDPVACEIKDVDLCATPEDPSCMQLCASADNGNGYVATLEITMANEVPIKSNLKSCSPLKKPKRIENGSIKHARYTPELVPMTQLPLSGAHTMSFKVLCLASEAYSASV